MALAPAVVAAPATPAASLSAEARWLQEYVRLDTRNPPGGEHRGAAYLASLLRREGIAHRLYVTPDGRTNLWAHLPAADSAAGTVVLLHHMDVVAPGEGWTAEPFGGEVREGALYGRGALDAKSLGVAQLAAVIDLHRRGRPLRRGIALLASADEEAGGGRGVGWLSEAHPELFRGVEAVVNEGGANRKVAGKLLWWGIEVAQKRPLWLEVEATGRPGHASALQPWSAAHELVRALARLLALPPVWRVTPAARQYLRAVAPLHNPHWRSVFTRIDEVIAPEGPREGLLPGMANLFLDSVQVTVLEAGAQINVIPDRARARIDIRLLPDTDAAAFLARVREALGPEIEARVLVESPPSAPSPNTNAVYRELADALDGEAPVVPVMIAGFTDSRYFRERGIPAYGFSPFTLEGDALRGIHGPDESIPLAEFDRGVERMKRLLRALAERP
jgi:acetylornithine deacetylase/succinyl-diaminopimelate desuccinylase-like protein